MRLGQEFELRTKLQEAHAVILKLQSKESDCAEGTETHLEEGGRELQLNKMEFVSIVQQQQEQELEALKIALEEEWVPHPNVVESLEGQKSFVINELESLRMEYGRTLERKDEVAAALKREAVAQVAALQMCADAAQSQVGTYAAVKPPHLLRTVIIFFVASLCYHLHESRASHPFVLCLLVGKFGVQLLTKEKKVVELKELVAEQLGKWEAENETLMVLALEAEHQFLEKDQKLHLTQKSLLTLQARMTEAEVHERALSSRVEELLMGNEAAVRENEKLQLEVSELRVNAERLELELLRLGSVNAE